MRHLILCPELPPAPIPPGGIGTYVLHVSRLLAAAGETVHVIGERWPGAPEPREEHEGGRLVVHRVALGEPPPVARTRRDLWTAQHEVAGLARLGFPPDRFAWAAGLLAEQLVEEEGIDLIEAQEYAAPLHLFQLRRALGLGPARRPPCLIHLHSPSEFIARHNDWDVGHPFFVRARQQEACTIAAGDALLCPSRHLAEEAEVHFGLERGAIAVIPLPRGETPLLERDAEVWERGSICYVGRLEARKGVIEWVDAAVSVAGDHPTLCFELIGADVNHVDGWTVRQVLEQRIPARLRPRFLFHGSLGREEILARLSRARLAVVPSRWENFPNTCVEAMATGLPVLATANGGMAEMIEDGRSGWIAPACEPAALAEALRRALATPAAELRCMGQASGEAIRSLCDNKAIVEQHLALRTRVASQPAERSLQLPALLPWARRPLRDPPPRRRTGPAAARGLAVVVTCLERGALLDECLSGLRAQRRAPAAVVVVAPERADSETWAAARRARERGWKVLGAGDLAAAAAKNAGAEEILSAHGTPLGLVFLDASDRLYPGFLEACEACLRHCPGLGLLSAWTRLRGAEEGFLAAPCPAFPYQLLHDATAPALVVRSEAFAEAGGFRTGLPGRYDRWDLANAVMAGGWVAATLPALLCERWPARGEATERPPGHGRLLRELLARVPEAVQRDALELVLLLDAPRRVSPAAPAVPLKPTQVLRRSLAAQWEVLGLAVRRPDLTVDWVRRQVSRVARRTARRPGQAPDARKP
jgi:glycosyltransferase involved in cell wall biosynthesis